MFAVFLARPCPFYILDEVEAALDDVNIDRFLQLVRRYSDRAQFIVVTHQKRTMDAADTPLRGEHGRRRRVAGDLAQARGRVQRGRLTPEPRASCRVLYVNSTNRRLIPVKTKILALAACSRSRS